MPLAPLLSEAITATTVPPRALFMGGGPNLLKSGVAGSFGVEQATVEVDEAGMNGISGMTFIVDDPAIAVTVADGQDIRYWDITNNFPIFQGWVQSWSYLPDFGNQGRRIAVRAIGPETLLDWALVTSLSITAVSATVFQVAVQMAVAAATGTGPLRAFANALAYTGGSSRDNPLGTIVAFALGAATVNSDISITTPTTLREVIRQIIAVSQNPTAGHGQQPTLPYWSVDMYFGLRTDRVAGAQTDYTDLTITDTSVGAIVAEDLQHEVNAAEIVRGVYIVGGNAAGTGLVPDGTGKPGPIATFSDTTILTAAALVDIGFRYLDGFGLNARGSFLLSDFTPVYTVHTGSNVIIQDARASLASPAYTIMSIHKTFSAVRENWTFTYGGLPPSLARSTRRLTRSTLS